MHPSKLEDIIDEYLPGDKIVFLDVREDDEMADGDLPTINKNGVALQHLRIPIVDVIEMRIEDLEQYKEDHQVFVYCRGGNASVTATRFLNLHGYDTVNISGGMHKIKRYLSVWHAGELILYSEIF